MVFNVQLSWNYCYDGGNRNSGVFACSSGARGDGSAVGAGLLGFGIGAIVGGAVTPQAVYVTPPPPLVYYVPPPPPVYYGAVVYGPPYRYGHYRYRHR